jgi:hypothetical protein
MKRFILLWAAVLAAVGALAGAASAAPTTHSGRLTFSGGGTSPAGSVCDFTLGESYTGTISLTFFSDGSVTSHTTLQVTHVNVDTGYTLTEHDVINETDYNDGTSKQLGVFWHLRDANGKIVVVHAGQITLDANFDVASFTPNSGPDTAAVLCPALGGNPA